MLPLKTEVNSCARAQNVKQYKKKYEKRQWWLCFFSYKDDQKERDKKREQEYLEGKSSKESPNGEMNK